jgi:ABC-type proline/glycine betaine transport system permease subunit
MMMIIVQEIIVMLQMENVFTKKLKDVLYVLTAKQEMHVKLLLVSWMKITNQFVNVLLNHVMIIIHALLISVILELEFAKMLTKNLVYSVKVMKIVNLGEIIKNLIVFAKKLFALKKQEHVLLLKLNLQNVLYLLFV